MTTTEAAAETEGRSRYDDMADGYARFWAPVLRASAERVLDHLDAAVEEATRAGSGAGASPRARLLDVGSRWRGGRRCT